MKLRLFEAEAKKKVAAAQGEAEALKIKGDAEAEYNRKISSIFVSSHSSAGYD